jgi:type VI secretion system secreted protein Hcp
MGALFMRIPGLSLPPSGTIKGHETDIPIFSFQFGLGVGIGAPPSGGRDRERSQVSYSEMLVSKRVDILSPLLAQHLVIGTEITKVEIFGVRTPQNIDVLLYQLVDVMISSYSVSSGGGDEASESISLNYGGLSTTVRNINPKTGVVQGEVTRILLNDAE